MSMTHDEMIAVIEHHKNGGEVEYCREADGLWVKVHMPSWDFHKIKYRKKPEPVYIYAIVSSLGRVLLATRKEDEARRISEHIKTPFRKFVEVVE